MSAPRVRFSPAPTGWLHFGSAHSALFNWLFARHHDGAMLLRIEDTDRERSKPEFVDAILRTLEWLGIDWDEAPVRQSERADVYRDAVEKLRADGFAYEDDGAIRFRVPDGTTEFDDVIRGHIVFENANLKDFVIQRSDGSATFFLPNAVDDVDMGITHVIRGEDLINATPNVLMLRRALGHDDVPVFAHLPLLVNEQRGKLSKRREDSAVEEYRDRGYLAEAIVNYLALLGWGPRDGIEVRPVSEVIELFRLEDVVGNPAFFDLQKLDHVNGEHIRMLSSDDFVAAAKPWLEQAPWPQENFDAATLERMAPEVQTRVVTLAEVPRLIDFLFLDEPELDERSWDKAMKNRELAVAVLDDALREFASCEWRADVLHETLRRIAESHDVKLNKAQAPVRVAITGRSVGPPLFESLEVLGRERALARLRAARERL